MFVPIANIAIAILLAIDFVKAYGKGSGFAVLAIFLPFIAYVIMAFDKNTRYVGAGVSYNPPMPSQPMQQYAQMPTQTPMQPQPPVANQPYAQASTQPSVEPQPPVQPPTPPQASRCATKNSRDISAIFFGSQLLLRLFCAENSAVHGPFVAG